MNDAELIKELGIFDIRISEAMNGTVNTNRICIDFKQSIIGSKYKHDDKDISSIPGLIKSEGAYIGQINHRFHIASLDNVGKKILDRAQAYKDFSLKYAREDD
jgi:hypothetical protein